MMTVVLQKGKSGEVRHLRTRSDMAARIPTYHTALWLDLLTAHIQSDGAITAVTSHSHPLRVYRIVGTNDQATATR